jgi:hypothetical protein
MVGWKYTLEAREINLSIKWRLQDIGMIGKKLATN